MTQDISHYWHAAVHAFNEKQFNTALSHLQNLLKLAPLHPQASLMAAQIFMQNNQPLQARQYFELARQLPIAKEKALIGLVTLAERTYDIFEQKTLLLELTSITSNNYLYHFHLGLAALACGDIELAEKSLLECIKANYYTPGLYLNLGHIYKAKGDTPQAAKFYHQHINVQKAHPSAGFWSLADLKNYSFTAEDHAAMQQMLNEANLSQGEQALMQFSQAKYLEQTEKYAEALSYYQQANNNIAALRPFKKAAFNNIINNLLRYNPTHNCEAAPQDDSLIPIFIVGMPRSGTTLTEQILSSHSQVEPTDELPFIERYAIDIQSSTDYGSAMNTMSEQTRTAIRQHYFKQASQYFSAKQGYFIDKNPNNFLHIGLIKLVFPEAKIINLLRNVADNSMAVFKQFFAQGHDYSYGIDSIIDYWQSYIRLMQHWDNCYPGQIMHLKYEHLVSEPEPQIRNLLDFIGLPFEEDCLHFYKSERVVLTPSSSQVRKPMNKKAIGQAKKYQPFLPQAFEQFTKLEQLVLDSFAPV